MKPEVEELCKSIVNELFDRAIHNSMQRWAEATHANPNSGAAILQFTRSMDDAFQASVNEAFNRIVNEMPINARQPADTFWTFVKEIIMRRATSGIASLSKTITERAKGLAPRAITSRFGQAEATLHGMIHRQYTQALNKDKIAKDTSKVIDPTSPDVAVMMWFPDMTDRPDDAKAAHARYELFCHLIAKVSDDKLRVRKYNDPDVVAKERISGDVERWLKDAKLVIADLTGLRYDVFYEFGFARGAGTHTISICPKDRLGELSMHIRSFQQVTYQTLNDLEAQLWPKIQAWFKTLSN